MLSLISLACRGLCADGSHPHLRPAFPVRTAARHLSSVSGTQKRCARTSAQDGGRRAVCRDAAPGTAIWSVNSAAAPAPRELRPLPADQIPIKQPRQPSVCGCGVRGSESMRSSAAQLVRLRSLIKECSSSLLMS